MGTSLCASGQPCYLTCLPLLPVWHRLLQGLLLTMMIRLCGHEQALIQLAYIQSITCLAQDLQRMSS